MQYLIAITLLLISNVSWALPPQFHSLQDGFRRFVDESKNADFETQLKNWVKDVEGVATEIYVHILTDGSNDDLEVTRRRSATRLFPFLIANSEAILAQFDTFSLLGKPVILKLAEDYPDLDMSKVEVWALPSLNTFNGQVATVNGRVRVMFGMDMVEQISEKPDFKPGAVLVNNLPVLMAHEYTHAIHYVTSDFGSPDHTTGSFLGSLWDEGLAQANSQILNPGIDLSTVYMERNLASACTVENVKKWSAEYLRDSTLGQIQIESAYARWFMMSTGLEEHGVYRAGYCLGYNVILSALQTYSMREILKMSRADAYEFERKTLAGFAASTLENEIR